MAPNGDVGVVDPHSEHTAQPGPKPFWTLRTCGFFVFALFVLAAALVGWLFYSFTRIAMQEPLPFERVSYEAKNAESSTERIQSGEEVTLSAFELSALVQSQYDSDPHSAGSKFRCDFSEPGRLRIQMSLKCPDDAHFPFAGRYINCDLTCRGFIERGDAAGFYIERFYFGRWYEYENATEEESREILRSMQQWKSKNPGMKLLFDRINLLRIEEGAITLRRQRSA